MIVSRSRIMEQDHPIRQIRVSRGLTQAELAAAANVARSMIGAIENGLSTPSVDAAIRIAQALGCTVEQAFSGGAESEPAADQLIWAETAPAPDFAAPFWRARVGHKLLHYQTEPTHLGLLAHDGVAGPGGGTNASAGSPDRTIVIACCDPAASLLLAALADRAGLRPIGLHRSSRRSLEMLQRREVHVAGLHLAGPETKQDSAEIVRDNLGPGYTVLRLLKWQAGIVARPGISTPDQLLRPSVRWLGRDSGTGSAECQNLVLDGRPLPRRIAPNHRAVADAIRSQLADAGAAVQLVAAEAGLGFVPVREEYFDLCFPTDQASDPRIAALIAAARSRRYRDALSGLPGHQLAAEAGELVEAV